MNQLNRQLGIYSIKKRNNLKQVIRWLTLVSSLGLVFLIFQQLFLTLNVNQNQIIHPKETPIETIKKVAPRKSLIIQKIEERPDMIILLLETGTEVFLDERKSLESQLGALQLIINQDKINGRKAKRIDLRFNNPIATY